MLLMPLLALLAPFGAVVLSLLLAIAVCYAAVYARLFQCFWRQSAVSPDDEALQLRKSVVKSVNMLGMHIEDMPDCNVITIKDQQTSHQQAVLQLFKAHAHRNSNIYPTFSNPEMEVLLLPGVGCMVYTTAAHWGLRVVVAVGDPVCDPQHDLLMLQTFRAVFPAAAVIDVSKDVARLWAGEEAKQPGLSMTVTDMGTETIVDVQKYNFDFNKRTKEIRRNAEAATRAGLIVEEVTAHSSDAIKAQVQQLAAEWQQGKEVTDDLKVFSRIIPFQHLGREKDARVFIARTLSPEEDQGSAPGPFTVAMATEQLKRQQAAAAAAAKLSASQAGTTEEHDSTTTGSSSAEPRSSEQRRLKRARRAAARQQQQQQQQHAAGAGADSAAAAVVIHAAAAAPPPPPPPPPPPAPSSASSDTDTSSDNCTVTCDTAPLSDKQRKQQHDQGTSSSSGSSACGGSTGSTASSHIHACVMLDPIYKNGQVVGYFVQRTFLCPRSSVKGAPKLVLKEVLSLMKAEGKAILSHGPAPAHNVKSGDYHGFTDCAWMRRSLQLCWEYGNSLYAFKNLAMAKASWGGGYSPEDDGVKFKEAVTLNRRFLLLPPSWRCQMGHGPLLLLVVFRHVGLLGDPWALFAFWRYW